MLHLALGEIDFYVFSRQSPLFSSFTFEDKIRNDSCFRLQGLAGI
jgi:hypothetical protein